MNGQKKLTITIKELGFLTVDLFEQIVAVRSDLCEVYKMYLGVLFNMSNNVRKQKSQNYTSFSYF